MEARARCWPRGCAGRTRRRLSGSRSVRPQARIAIRWPSAAAARTLVDGIPRRNASPPRSRRVRPIGRLRAEARRAVQLGALAHVGQGRARPRRRSVAFRSPRSTAKAMPSLDGSEAGRDGSGGRARRRALSSSSEVARVCWTSRSTPEIVIPLPARDAQVFLRGIAATGDALESAQNPGRSFDRIPAPARTPGVAPDRSRARARFG